jgi:hypothetical protein
MTPLLKKAVREAFAEGLSRSCPRFAAAERGSTPPGCDLYVCAHPGGLFLSVLLDVDAKRDRFTVELGASPRRPWPATLLPGVPGQPARDGERRLRLARLWHAGLGVAGAKAMFWELTGDEEQARAQVADAVAKLAEHGVPWLERIAAGTG